MNYYWLRLYPEQPLHLDNPMLIPGRAIRGAAAAVTLRGCAPGDLHEGGACSPNCAYWPLFGATRHPIRFGAAYYASSGDESAPFPTTAQTCSALPGFTASGQHGVVDVAIRQWSFEQTFASLAQLYAPFETRCAVCDAALQPCAGLLIRHGERQFAAQSDVIQPISTEHRPMSRVNRARRDAPGLELFTQHGTLPARSACYVARLNVPEALDQALRAVLDEGLILGGRRTRGMGAVRAELVARPDPALTLHDRIAAFNRALRTEGRFYVAMGSYPLLSDEGYLYLTLDFNEGVLRNYTRQPSLLSDIKALRNATLLRQWLRPQVVGGRNTASGLPTRTQLAFAGVLLCRIPPEEDRTALEQALSYLEHNGIGLERERGYGSLTVCDPFHLEMEPL